MSAYGRPKTTEMVNWESLKVSASAYEKVRLIESINAVFVWEEKRGFEKISVSGAVRLRERP